LRAHDPDALLILNFSFLADDIVDFLETYGTEFDGDIVSYDLYSRSNGSYTQLAGFRQAGLDYDMPYWRYMNSYMGADLEYRHHESDQRWDAFSGLVFGYTGHTWFIYQIKESHDLHPILFEYNDAFDAPKTAQWAVHAQINLEMAHLGRAITQLTSTEVRYVPTLDLYLPENMTLWAPGAGGDPYITLLDRSSADWGLEILAGFFRDYAGEIYVMVQNVRHENGDFPSNSTSPGTIHIEFDFSSAPVGFDKTSVLSLNKLNGQVEEVPLSSSQGNIGTLDVTLPAGDPFFFKYKTGASFVLGP